MTYHPNTNRRHRRILNLIARKLLSHYRHGLPPEIQINGNNSHPLSDMLVMYGEDEKIRALPSPIKVSSGNGKVVAYQGNLSPDMLKYLYLFS